MKVIPVHQARSCINTVKLVEKHATEYISLIATPIPVSHLSVDGIAAIETPDVRGLRLEALLRTYTLPLSYAYSGESGPLGVLTLQEVLPREEFGPAIMHVVFDGNGEVEYSDGTRLSMFGIGRDIPADMVRHDALYKFLGAIIAALPSPPGSEGGNRKS